MVSPAVSLFFRRRLVELAGLFSAGFAVFMALALFSYDVLDPSFNNEVQRVPANLAGTAGAYVAVPLLEFIGLSATMLVIVPLIWGLLLISRRRLSHLWLKITALVLLLPSASALAAVIDIFTAPPEGWPFFSFGGYIGDYMRHDLNKVLGDAGFAAVFFPLTLLALYGACGLKLRTWGRMLRVALYPLRWLHALFRWFRHKVIAVAQQRRTGEKIPKVRKPKKSMMSKKTETPEKKRTITQSAARSTPEKRKGEQTTFDLALPDAFRLPPLNLLKAPSAKSRNVVSESALSQNAEMLEKVLEDFGIQGRISNVHPGPVVTLYELEPSPGTKSSRVIGLADDIARSMSAVSARIAVIPGKNAIGIELPNNNRETVFLRELLEAEEYQQSENALGLALGKQIGGEPMVVDLARMPHLLVAGTTGSGKSVGVNAMILSLLYKYSPAECRFIMIDPKMLELSVYEGIPHLLTPVVTEPGKAVVALKWTVKEMENRYRLMSNLGVRNVNGYNERILQARQKGEELTRSVQTGFDPDTGRPIFEKVPLEMTPLPYIVVVVDEMADLMITSGKDIEASIQRLAQMARAAGIHIIMATQRPSVDVITGVIKANFPTRISFQVTSRIDSRTILGEQGAEQLLGQGDMLYMAGGNRITRVHGPFVDDKEVEKVVRYLKEQGSPAYIEEVTQDEEEMEGFAGAEGAERDELYDRAVEVVIREGRASTSFVQRALKIGYNRAANIIEQMEKEGIVSKPNHSGKREVIVGS